MRRGFLIIVIIKELETSVIAKYLYLRWALSKRFEL